MTKETDRIPVPTNGKSPRAMGPGRVPKGALTQQHDDSDAADTNPMIELSPTRLVVGFGVLASLILLVRRRRRDR